MSSSLMFVILDSILLIAAGVIGWSVLRQSLTFEGRPRPTIAIVSVSVGYGIAIGGWQMLLIVCVILLLLSYCAGGRVDSERL